MNALRESWKRQWEIARLDLVDVRQSRWVWFHTALYLLLAAMFLFVGMRESQVLGFTGMGRVLLSLCNALVLVLPLLALTASVQVVNRYRQDGTLELLFSLPISRWELFSSVSAIRYLSVLGPLLVLIPAIGCGSLLIRGAEVPWNFMGTALAMSATLLWCFVGVGLAISTWVRSPGRALVCLLLAWIAGVGLLDFALLGLMLQWHVQPETVFLLSALNPVQCARLALLSAAEPSLNVLGPVGFYLAHRIGSGGLFALGVLQPLVVGLGAWLAAWASLRKGDLV